MLEVLPCPYCKSLSESAEGCAGGTGGLCYAAGGAAVEALIGPAWDVLGLGERAEGKKVKNIQQHKYGSGHRALPVRY